MRQLCTIFLVHHSLCTRRLCDASMGGYDRTPLGGTESACKFELQTQFKARAFASSGLGCATHAGQQHAPQLGRILRHCERCSASHTLSAGFCAGVGFGASRCAAYHISSPMAAARSLQHIC